MSKVITYLYASGDLLETKNTYFYTKYYGEPFLLAWRQSREDARVDKIKTGTTPENCNYGTTDQLLSTLFHDLIRKEKPADTRRLLNKILQRFEVTKRLHGDYNENWRPVNNMDYHCIERYINFAEILELAYSEFHFLPYLNALLKCLDTLTSLRGRLNEMQRIRLNKLINLEHTHVAKLVPQSITQL